MTVCNLVLKHLILYIVEAGFKNANTFHVQFFGDDAERGWVAESAMVPYEGPESLEVYCKEMLKKEKKNKKWIHKVTPARKPGWDRAVKSAQEAFPMSRAERKQTFTFIYEPPKEKKSASKAGEADLLPNGMLAPRKQKQTKRKLSDKNAPPDAEESSATEPPKKRRKRSQTAGSGANKLANQGLTQFMVFCQKRRDSIRKEHPEYSDSQVEESLRAQWDKLDPEQRSKFIPMGSDVKNLSEMIPTYESLADSEFSI